MFQYEVADITTDDVLHVATKHGWKQISSNKKGIIIIESPDGDKTRLILCEPGMFSDERHVMLSAIQHLSLWLLRKEIGAK